MQRRSAAGDSSPNAPACRSHRGKAPEGSSLLSPRVEARSAEDRGRGCQERYTTPPGCRTYQGVMQPVRHPCGVAEGSARRPTRGRGGREGSLYIGHRFADDRCLWSEHPSGASRISPLTPMLKCVTPVTIADQCLQTVGDTLKFYSYEVGTRKKCFIPDSSQSRLVSVPLKYFIPTLMEHTHPA